MYSGQQPEKLEEDLLQHFKVNVVGNIHLFNVFIPFILKGKAKKVIALTTGFADDKLTKDFEIDISGPYSISKAAMNTAVAKFDAEYGKQGVLFLAISPGLVETGQNEGIDCTS